MGSKKEAWFDYYAGYSPDFVRTVMEELLPEREGRILDPWNGSGTTTTTAYEFGVCSTGIDINPVMAVVAKAKLLTQGVQESLIPLADEIVAKSQSSPGELRPDDSLLEWFTPTGAQGIRHLEQAIRKLLTTLKPSDPLYTSYSLDSISDIAAFFLVALFKTTRSFLARFQGSNPTWIKAPRTSNNRVRPRPSAITEAFRNHVCAMIGGIVPVARDAIPNIWLGSSEHLPLAPASVSAVVGSPPYCTRIDYAVATKPELAVLGYPISTDFVQLRRRMLGGPVVLPEQPCPDATWGPACLKLLKRVSGHPTKGSGNYYYKLLLQYYSSMFRSLQEINRTLVSCGDCVLVVQDSHYKEVHVDVAGHIMEMALHLGWSVKRRQDFEARQLMARLNPKAQKYRSYSAATESVLWLRSAP